MAKPKSPEERKSDQLPVRIRPITRAYLQDLKETGAYGTSMADIMRRFTENGIRRALEAGVIVPKKLRDVGETVSEDEED